MNLIIDNKSVKINRPVTILEAADKNGIYIPRLCAHPELVPYGGCRLCIVEVEGMKGYPTACTTSVKDGMIVRTNTNMLQQMRIDLIQLILSEHPSACLLCEEVEGCSKFQETIRKVGVTTGCRWCPKDKDCELQRVVESFNINKLSLPGLYRDLPVEKYDPFFDRDYNLCIYCGRCVRICSEYRKSSVIALKQRGKHTNIGPSFESDHTDAGCEYCGACVSVCPTGALSEKSRKWWGIHDTIAKSLCPLCSINCEIQVISQRDRIVGTIPPGKPHEAAGELCVKGRFCLSELVNRTERVLEPLSLFPEGEAIIDWKEAIKIGGELLSDLPEGRSVVFVSPDLSIEEYMAVSEFADKVLKTTNISSSCFNYKMIAYQQLALKSVPVSKIRESTMILSLFLNGNYNFGPLTMAIKDVAGSGVPYYSIGWMKDTTTRFATETLVPLPGEEVGFLDQIIDCLETNRCNNNVLRQISMELRKSKNSMIIAGPWLLSLTNCYLILDRIRKIGELTGSSLFMPDPYGNLKGLMATIALKPLESVHDQIEKGRTDLIYLIGDMPFTHRPDVKKLIYQGAFPISDNLKPDLVLPSTIWGEAQGTWQGMNGSTVKIKRAAKAHDYALTNIEILVRLSASAGNKEAKESIKKRASEIPEKLKPRLPEMKIENSKADILLRNKEVQFVFILERSPHNYMNLNLDRMIEGLNELVSPDHLILNSADAVTLKIENGEIITVSDNNTEISYPVKIRKNVPEGVVCLIDSRGAEVFNTNPCYVKIRRTHV